MTALNKQALRQTAEKATPGPWEMEHENIWFRDTEGYTKHLMYAYQGDDVDDQQDHDNTAYIAAFNPKVVLALLDELEAKDVALSLNDYHFDQNADRIKSLEKALEAAEKRMAELEANKGKPVMFIDGDISASDAEKLAAVIREMGRRTSDCSKARAVTLPDVEKWRSVDDVSAQNAYKVLVSKVLAAAGIGVKGE